MLAIKVDRVCNADDHVLVFRLPILLASYDIRNKEINQGCKLNPGTYKV